MCEHRPEPAERFRRHAWPKLRDIAFQIGADEVLAPHSRTPVAVSEETVRVAAPDPQSVGRSSVELKHIERAELDIGDTPGKAFAGLLEQIDRGRAQQQKPAGPFVAPAAAVDESPQRFEQGGHALDLVEHDQLIFVVGEVEGRISELLPIGDGLKIEIDARAFFRDGFGERRLPDLPRPQKGHRRKLVQAGKDRL